MLSFNVVVFVVYKELVVCWVKVMWGSKRDWEICLVYYWKICVVLFFWLKFLIWNFNYGFLVSFFFFKYLFFVVNRLFIL